MSAERRLALLGFGLLALAPVTWGLTALGAAVLAYARRPSASEPMRRVWTGQIRLFWTAVALALFAAALGATAFILALEDGFGLFDLGLRGPGMERIVASLGIGAVVLFMVDAAVLLAASILGFVRLASRPPIGETAA